jgi:hypothetical protein
VDGRPTVFGGVVRADGLDHLTDAGWAARDMEDRRAEIEAIRARKRTSSGALILELLASLDAETYLRDAGLGDDALIAIRARLPGSLRGQR